ncbi:MAG: TRZ/ATZ family hydrolase [Nevskiaceae bacterium]|nr:MAG: TRZ/ATZ family hydrolase [Nevskiaceae bacterium]TBR74666.1 MAG: TRZ/ATZ family hydrolase [Nevskiaceae bacterium]
MARTPVDLVVLPRWLVPIQPTGAVLTEHALVVNAGRIVDIQPAAFADQLYAPAATRELPDHALLPGFVNAHAHSAMTLLRGLADDLPLMDWLNHHIWPAEAAHVGPDFCRVGVTLACAEMLRSGTTCFNDMYFFPEVTAEVVHHVRMRACIGLIVLDFPSAWAQDADGYIRRGLEVHDDVKALNDLLVTTAFAPHAPYTVSDAPLLKIRRYANELDIPIHMHVHETAAEVQAPDASGRRPWQRLMALGLPGPDFIAVHMTQLTDVEFTQVVESGTSVVHCPESNLKLASGFCPAAKLLGAGVNVALGTDGAASNNDLDMWGEMRTAALLAKGVAQDATALPAATALHMATLGGAHALGLGDEIGSLEKGKAADFIAVDLSGPEAHPVYNVLSQLVYATGRAQVTDVWVAGQALLRDRQLTTLDLAALRPQVAEWQGRVAATKP